MAQITRNKPLKVASMFCGCGGSDLGIIGGFNFLNIAYKKLPFEIVYALDNDPYALSLYNANFKDQAFCQDIREVLANKMQDFDLLLGGFPCQSFSIAAQNPIRLGYKDEKGKLFFELVRILKVKKPRFFICENVKGLLSANKGQAFKLIMQEFKNAGYYTQFKVLNAYDFGVPQKRERIFIIGFKNKVDFNNFQFPAPIIEENKTVLKQVIDPSANDEEKWFFSQKAIDGMLKNRAKMNKGRVQNLNEPCNTIGSHLAKVSLNGTDPVLMINNKYRRFTPREAANIQSFPLSFKLDVVSENRQYRAIGNAIPPVLMWHLANALIACIKQI